MNRWMYRSQVKPDHLDSFGKSLREAEWEKELMGQGILTCSIFQKDHQLFVYMESLSSSYHLQWPETCRGSLEAWPGDKEVRYAVPMMDIFHDGVPESPETWRTAAPTERIGSLARLRPEMYSSYVFYHYQMQEEAPQSFNKTYRIGAHEHYIFSYQEYPAVVDKEKKPRGKLLTRNTPANWHEVMQPHFILWHEADESRIWARMDCIFTF